MKKPLIMAAVVLALTVPTGAAFASDCPNMALKIEDAISAQVGTPESRAVAKMMVSEGRRLHDAGEHDKSVKTLSNAMKELGIE